MFDEALNRWLLSLDGHQVVQVMRALLIAEGNRLGLPTGAVDMPANSNAPDGGIDARTDVPRGAATLLPEGIWSWQVKSGKSTPNLTKELSKRQVKLDLDSGRGYILAWVKESATPRDQQDKWLRDAVDAAYGSRTAAKLLLCVDVERLIQVHPTVAQTHGAPQILALTLADWAKQLRLREFPLQQDDLRRDLMRQIVEFCLGADARQTHLRLFGDSGVGKSRLVYEALAGAGLESQAAVALSPSGLSQERLNALVASQSSHAIVICDDCDDAYAATLEKSISAAAGRLRLITIGDRPKRSTLAGPAEIEVMPLGEGAIANLVQQVAGLQREDAELVAGMSEGYPKLAVELAHAIPKDGTRPSVIALLRSRRVEQLLDKMLPDAEARRMLGHLAIVERIGFTEELAGETDELCRAFDLDVHAFRRVIETETGRFVARVERYRRITPRALAASLFVDLINQNVASYAARIVALPERLFDEFREQIQLLGGDLSVDALIREVAALRADSFLSPHLLTVEGARLLNAIAFAIPELGAELIESLVGGRGLDELAAIGGARRRDLVWALEHLLWFRSTFEVAANCLLPLAAAETEAHYANNATGVLVGAFQLQLGGTEVPIQKRLQWLEEAASRYAPQSVLLTAKAASTVLAVFQGRTGGWRGARLQPTEWRPANDGEVVDAHLRAWRLLREVASENEEIEKIAREAVGSVLVVPRNAELFRQVVADVPTMSWSPQSRGELISSARLGLGQGELSPELRQLLGDLIDALGGPSADERLDVMIHTPFWKLASEEERATVPLSLTDAATLVLAQPELADRLRRVEDGDWLTQFYLFREAGLQDEGRNLAALALASDSREAARIGYISGRGSREPRWADELLTRWLDDPNRGAEIPAIVGRLEPSDARALIAVSSVIRGLAQASALSHLSVGSWTRNLDPSSVQAILSAIAGDDSPVSTRSALWIVDSWIDGHPDADDQPSVVEAVMPILRRAVRSEDSGLTYSTWQAVRRLGIPFAERLALALSALSKGSLLWEPEIEAWRRLAQDDGPSAARALVASIAGDDEGWSYIIQGSHLVSLVRTEAGTDAVWTAITETDVERRFRLLDHVDFTRDELDPLVVRWLDEDPSPELQNETSAHFAFPHQVITGSYTAYLQRRLGVLQLWSAEHPSESVRLWTERMIPDFERWIRREARKEAEERL